MTGIGREAPDLTVYICGESGTGKTTIAREVAAYLHNRGVKIVEYEDPQSGPQPPIKDQQRAMRALIEMETRASVKTANFPAERVVEFLDREALEGAPPVFLSQIHWGNNLLSQRIFPGSQYLVRINENWYTGTFRLDQRQQHWEFLDVDYQGLEGTNQKRYALTRENPSGRGIREIYEVIGRDSNPARR